MVVCVARGSEVAAGRDVAASLAAEAGGLVAEAAVAVLALS